MLNIMLLMLGKFLEPISVMIVTMPILIKVANMIGMDMVQFGVMVTLNVVIGMVTPPVGILPVRGLRASGTAAPRGQQGGSAAVLHLHSGPRCWWLLVARPSRCCCRTPCCR